MYNRNNDNSNSYNNTATNVSVAAQQSTLLYLGAKVREVEKRLRKRDGVDLSGEDAYLCLEVLSLCSDIYSPIQPALKTMRPFYQRMIYPTNVVNKDREENNTYNYEKVSKEIPRRNQNHVNKVNVEIEFTDEDLRCRRPYYVMYQYMKKRQEKNKMDPQSKITIGKIPEKQIEEEKGDDAKNKNKFINRLSTIDTEKNKNQKGDVNLNHSADNQVVEQHRILTKKCHDQEEEIHNLKFEVLELKKDMFILKRQMGKSQLEIEKRERERKKRKEEEGDYNDDDDNMKHGTTQDYSSKMQDKEDCVNDRTKNNNNVNDATYDDGKDATNITNTDWGERKKRRNRLLMENLSLQEELRMANLQIQLLERKMKFQG